MFFSLIVITAFILGYKIGSANKTLKNTSKINKSSQTEEQELDFLPFFIDEGTETQFDVENVILRNRRYFDEPQQPFFHPIKMEVKKGYGGGLFTVYHGRNGKESVVDGAGNHHPITGNFRKATSDLYNSCANQHRFQGTIEQLISYL